MDFSDTHYIKITKTLLSIVGLWPYQKRLSRYCFGGLTILLVLISITPVYWFTLYKTIATGDMDSAMKVIPSYTLMAASQAKLCNLFFGNNNFKELLDFVNNDWKNMSKTKYKQILFDYAKFGKKMTFMYCVYCYMSLCIFAICATSPKILNALMPLTKRRPIHDLFYIEYYVDKEKYDLVYTVHTFIVSFSVTTIAIANDSLELIFVQHACTKFTILGHRIRNVIHQNSHDKLNIIRFGSKYNTKKVEEAKIQKTTSEKIIFCIQEHKKVIEFVNLIQVKYSNTLIYVMMHTMFGFFITGFQVVTNLDSPSVASKNGILFIGKLIHTFMQNWIGQRLIDHSYVFNDSVYKSPWFEMTVKERRLLLMLLLRSRKPCKIRAGVVFTMSTKTFRLILTRSMSYFTALKSIY